MGLIAKSMRGTEGRVTLPGMGALIGEMWSWQAYSEDGQTYVLRASCNHLHDSLWKAATEDLEGGLLRIEISLGRDSWFVAKPNENANITRNGRDFTIKTVTLEKLEN